MPPTAKISCPELSILLPFRDDEEVVGTACSRLAAHLRGLGVSFELLAIEEDSGDNSHAILGLLREQIPELQVLYASARERGFATGAASARGRAVLLIDVGTALKPLAPLSRAIQRVLGGETDAVFAPNRFAVCHRTRTLDSLKTVRGHKLSGLRRRIAGSRGRVELLGRRERRWLRPRSRSEGRGPLLARLMTGLSLSRF